MDDSDAGLPSVTVWWKGGPCRRTIGRRQHIVVRAAAGGPGNITAERTDTQTGTHTALVCPTLCTRYLTEKNSLSSDLRSVVTILFTSQERNLSTVGEPLAQGFSGDI